MPVTLTIVADSAAELVQEFRTLNTETTPSNTNPFSLAAMPLDTLIEIVRDRLRDDGFKLEVVDQRDQNPPDNSPVMDAPVPETGPQVEPPAAPEDTAPKTRKGKGVKTPPATPVDAPEDLDAVFGKAAVEPPQEAPKLDMSDPEGDRQRVLDYLVRRREDAKLKPKVDAFIARMSTEHGTSKMFEIKPEFFPAIKVEMLKEFPDAAKSAR